MKRATFAFHKKAVVMFISIHALVKRATVTNPLIYKDTGDFNPRPHEEGDAALQPQSLTLVISIHALMKRATYSDFRISQ